MASTVDEVPKEVELTRLEGALFSVELQTSNLCALHYLLHSLFFCSTVDKIIVHKHLDTLQSLQGLSHLTLEDLRCPCYAKWQLLEVTPASVMKVVSLQLSGCSSIWKNPLAAPSDEKNVAPLSFATISSAVGRTYCYLLTASFSLLKST